MSENNTATTLKVIFWGTLLFIGSIVIMAYLPIIKAKIPVMPVTTIATENTTTTEKETRSDVFSTYEVKGSNIIVNSYLDGIVFNSSDNYIVTVLNDDMGYILTTVEENGATPEVYNFVGKGWFNMTTSPVIQKEDETTINSTNDNFIEPTEPL